MNLNTEYKQIYLNNAIDSNILNGKVVDKIGFINRGYEDENIFAITFTDKTFIAIGTSESEWENYKDEPSLNNFIVINPVQYASGGLSKYFYLDNNLNPVLYNSFVKVLADLGIWNISAEDLQKEKEKREKDEEEREYKNYLRLKEKFEKIGI